MFTAIELIGEAIAGATIVASCGLNYLKVAAKIKDNERWLKAPLYDADGKVVPQNTSTAIALYTTSYGPSLLNKSTPTIFPKKVKCIDGLGNKLLPGKIYTAVNDGIHNGTHRYFLEEINDEYGWRQDRFEDVKEEVKPPPTIYGNYVSEATAISNAKLVWTDKSQEYITNSDSYENVSSYKINKRGDQSWWLNGKLHRTDGPAVEYSDGTKYWHLNGKKHRADGPAIEYASGGKLWYINGKKYSEEDFNAIYNQGIKNHSGITCGAQNIANAPAVEDASGTEYWHLNGKLHRTDGPAVELVNGDKSWYLNGQRHRTDGPAIEYANGNKSWYINGKLHRTDGPAIEYADGSKEWWFKGVKVSEEEHKRLTGFYNYFADVDKPASFEEKQKIVELENIELHEYPDGKAWCIKGTNVKHRVFGPAVQSGGKEWWFLYGKEYSESIHKSVIHNKEALNILKLIYMANQL